jgi:diguanylate cyclase (GGDEF)-like protein/PAS domain S-box-containing protein
MVVMASEDNTLLERQYRAVWDLAGDAMAFLDTDGLLDCNEAGVRLFGLANREELLGRYLSDFAPLLQPQGMNSHDHVAAQIAQAFAHGRSRFDCQLRRGDGSLLMADISLHRLSIGGGHTAHAVFRDITARWQIEQRLRNTKDAIEASLHQLAHFDTVTGLPNRSYFLERASLALQCAVSSHPMVLCSIAVGDNSRINNTLGFEAGDGVLRTIAERLQLALRAQDIVGRVGGNAFCVLYDGCTADYAARNVRTLLDTIVATPIRIVGREVPVALVAGLSIYGEDGDDIWDLMQNADTAMCRAKADGAENLQFYRRDMNALALERLALEGSIRRGIEEGEFVVYYQPLITADDKRIIGAEALVRWQHPELGLVGPDRFIPLAEQSNLIVALGEWVLQTACRQVQAWRSAGLAPLEIAVNLSPRQFRQSALCEMVVKALADSGLDPGQLVLELTEGALMDSSDRTLRVLAQFREMGVRLAIDDFGTGYSSLSYLKNFPIHKLKVDQSFVRDIGGSDDGVVIAQAIVNLGHNLHLEVIAEGIETQEEFDALQSYGCNYMQGYYFSRPVPAMEFEALLRQQG